MCPAGVRGCVFVCITHASTTSATLSPDHKLLAPPLTYSKGRPACRPFQSHAPPNTRRADQSALARSETTKLTLRLMCCWSPSLSFTTVPSPLRSFLLNFSGSSSLVRPAPIKVRQCWSHR